TITYLSDIGCLEIQGASLHNLSFVFSSGIPERLGIVTQPIPSTIEIYIYSVMFKYNKTP
ncbi:hypothetical protein, partial [Escherichia sp. 0.2392]|uniref:hypothetical protein n=1 Tax=Escherichia sp. 0.2392 TaxID=2730946 RepID=UPI001A920251